MTQLEATLTARLASITIGHTTTVRGVVVTRWAADRFELETLGRYTEKLAEAAMNLPLCEGFEPSAGDAAEAAAPAAVDPLRQPRAELSAAEWELYTCD